MNYHYTRRWCDGLLSNVLAPAIRAAKREPDAAESEVDFTRLVGVYQLPLGGESVVLEWRGGLAVLGLPTRNPLRSMERLDHTGDGLFRRAGTRDSSADLVRFEEDEHGRMRMWRDHQYSVRKY